MTKPRTAAGLRELARLNHSGTHSCAGVCLAEVVAAFEAEAAEPAPLDADRVAEWLHRNAATKRVITCGPDSTGCRQKHRQDARDLIEYARLAAGGKGSE